MSAKQTKIRRLLDKLLGSRWSVFAPILVGLVMYALFAIFGAAEEKQMLLVMMPVIGAICFFGCFLVLWFQTSRTKDAVFAARYARFLDVFTLIAWAMLLVGSLGSIMPCLTDISNFQVGAVVYPMAVAAIAWAHQKRRD